MAGMMLLADSADGRQSVLCRLQDSVSPRISYSRSAARADCTQLLSGTVSPWRQTSTSTHHRRWPLSSP